MLRAVLNARVGSKSSYVKHSRVHHYQSAAEWTDTFFHAYQATGVTLAPVAHLFCITYVLASLL